MQFHSSTWATPKGTPEYSLNKTSSQAVKCLNRTQQNFWHRLTKYDTVSSASHFLFSLILTSIRNSLNGTNSEIMENPTEPRLKFWVASIELVFSLDNLPIQLLLLRWQMQDSCMSWVKLGARICSWIHQNNTENSSFRPKADLTHLDLISNLVSDLVIYPPCPLALDQQVPRRVGCHSAGCRE